MPNDRAQRARELERLLATNQISDPETRQRAEAFVAEYRQGVSGNELRDETGFYRAEDGQRHLTWRAPDVLDEAPDDVWTRMARGSYGVTRAVGRGLTDAARGIVELEPMLRRASPAGGAMSLLSALGGPDLHERLDRQTQAVSDAIPQVDVGNNVERAGAFLTQYAAPAGAAVRGGNAIAQGVRNVVPQTPRWVSNVVGQGAAAGLTDFAVTDPDQAETLGNVVGGPTRIRDTDSDLTRRLRVGAEGAGLTAGATGLFRAVGAGWDAGRRALSDEQTARQFVRRYLTQTLENANPDRADAVGDTIAVLSRDVPEDMAAHGVRPSTGTIVARQDPTNTALLEVERGAISNPRVAGARRDNTGRLLDATRGRLEQSGNPADVVNAADEQLGRLRSRLQEQMGLTANQLNDAEQILSRMADDLSGRFPDVTANDLADMVLGVLRNETGRKSEAFNAAMRAARQSSRRMDARTIGDALGPLRETDPIALENFLTTTGRSDIGRVSRFVRDAMRAGSFHPHSMEALRPVISRAISQARQAGDGGNIKVLEAVRGAFNDYLQQAAERARTMARQGEAAGGSYEQAAREAIDYMRDTYAPLFREGAGARVAANARSNYSTLDNALADMNEFIRRGNEGGEQLRAILERSDNPAQALNRVQDHLLSMMGQSAINNGQIVPGRIETFMRKNGGFLEAFPEVRTAFQQTLDEATGAVGARTAAQAGMRDAERAITDAPNASDLTRVFSGRGDETAARTIPRIFNDANPVRTARNIIGELRASAGEEGVTNLRRAFSDYLEERVLKLQDGTSAAATTTIDNALRRLRRHLSQTSDLAVLREVYGGDTIRAWQQVQAQIADMDMINSVRVTTGSPTEPLRQARRNYQDLLLSLGGDLKGRAQRRSMMGILAFIRRRLGQSPENVERIFSDVIGRALTDPQYARELLKGETLQAQLRTAARAAEFGRVAPRAALQDTDE